MPGDVDISTVGKKPGFEVWRVKSFTLEPVPKNEYGQFYTGDAYVCLNTKHLQQWDIHFWLGEESTTDEIGTAAIKAVEIDRKLGDWPVQHREIQNHESSLFLSYFPNGIRYIPGGYDSGYHHVEDMFKNFKPRLYHCKGKRNVRCTQVEFKKGSLNLGDVFILDLGREIYVWMPPKSGRLERIRGMVHAKNIADHERNGESTVHILDSDWDTDEVFWSHFGGLSAVKTVAKAREDDENYWKRTTEQMTLWRVSDASGTMKVTKVAQGEVKRSLLDTKDAFILDAVNGGLFVWVGKGCTLGERAKAMHWGEQYLREKKLPSWTHVTRVLESAEPSSFTQWITAREIVVVEVEDKFENNASTDGAKTAKSWIRSCLLTWQRSNGRPLVQDFAVFPRSVEALITEKDCRRKHFLGTVILRSRFLEWEDSKEKKSFEPRLFQVSDETGKMVVEEIANFDQESLDGDDVMILDALYIIYVWVGAGANQEEKKGALSTAKKYLEQGNLPRIKQTTIETIYQGRETPSFKKFFPSWNDELFQSDGRSVANMRKLLFS